MYRINFVGLDGSRYGYNIESGYSVISWITRILCELFQDVKSYSSISVYSYRSRKIIFRIKF